MNSKKTIAKKLIQKAKKEDIYLVLRFQNFRSKYFNVKNGQVDDVDITEGEGCGIQAFTETGHFSFVSVDTDSDLDRLFKSLDTAIKLAHVSQESDFEPIREIFDLDPERGEVNQSFKKNPFKVDNEKIKNDLKEFQKAVKYDDFSKSNSLWFSDNTWRIFRTDGTDVGFKVLNSGLISNLSSRKDDPIEVYQLSSGRGYEVISEKHIKEHLEKLDKVVSYARKYKSAKSIKPGNYPLLLDSGLAGTFVHEAFGHTAESDYFYQRSPLLEDGKMRRGLKVAEDFVNIFDEATKDERGFFPFSGYGYRRKKVNIVKRGKLHDLLTDLPTYKKVGANLNGASKMQSFASIPIPRMSCTQISLDEDHSFRKEFDCEKAEIKEVQKMLLDEDVFKQYPSIVYLKRSTGGNVDTTEGNFQFKSFATYRLTEEKIEVLKPASFSGKTLQALKSIEKSFGKRISNPGTCGKSGQSVPETTKAPMLLLKPNKFVFIG